MSNVLIAAREAAQVQERFHDVLASAGLTPLYPNTGKPTQLTEQELLTALDGIEAIVAGSEPYTSRVLTAHPQLRVIARVGVGYDAVDVAAATAQGAVVTITPGTNHGSVAEHTFALMLGFTRHLPARHQSLVQGGWPRLMSTPLRGQTLGLAGLGRIGKAVAIRALAFEMKVIAFDPHPDAEFCSTHGITLVPFERLLSDADFLSLHLPSTPSTRHLINRATLARMKPECVLINTSRGGLIHEGDLLMALRERNIRGAALDVFEQEPLPTDHPLRGLDNVVLTPHAAGLDILSLGDMARSAAEAIAGLRRGEWPMEKVINPEVRPNFHWS